jgi:hypothetical protein
MGIVSPGFTGRRRATATKLPPGQYLVHDFPVLSAGPTPGVRLDRWEFRITTETGQVHRWGWEDFRALPAEDITVDLHCVTKWSKLGTAWRGVSLDTLMSGVATSAGFALARSVGDYTTNLPLADLLDGKAWIAFSYGGADLTAEQLYALVDLVARFAGRLPAEVAEAEMRRVDAAGAENLWFAWAGSTERGDRHYFRVQGPGLLIEHDNTQGDGNHVHSVWRVPGGDFGDDLLAAHYRAEKH